MRALAADLVRRNVDIIYAPESTQVEPVRQIDDEGADVMALFKRKVTMDGIETRSVNLCVRSCPYQ